MDIDHNMPGSVDLELSTEERSVLNDALFKKILEAATLGPQLDPHEILTDIARRMLASNVIMACHIDHVNSEVLLVMSDCLERYGNGTNRAKRHIAQDMSNDMFMAARKLCEERRQIEIENIMSSVIVPDSLEEI